METDSILIMLYGLSYLARIMTIMFYLFNVFEYFLVYIISITTGLSLFLIKITTLEIFIFSFIVNIALDMFFEPYYKTIKNMIIVSNSEHVIILVLTQVYISIICYISIKNSPNYIFQ